MLFRKVRGGGCCAHGQSPPFPSFQGVLPVSPASWEGGGRSPHLGHSGGSSGFWLQELLICGHWGALKALHFVALVFWWGSACLVEARLPCGHLPLLDLTELLEPERTVGQGPSQLFKSRSARHPSGGFGQVLSSQVSIVMLVKWSRHLSPQTVLLCERHQTA